MKTSIELFAWPWDILDRGPERFIGDCKELGVNRVHTTTIYHSGKFLLPRNQTARVYFPESGRLFVPVKRDSFAGSNIRPHHSAIASSGWLERLSHSASEARIALAAWTVFHHSSALAGEHEEHAIRNLFGDVYRFALCPSHESVRAYALDLASAIQSTGVFDTLDLETIGYLGYAHGYHHEVAAVPVGTFERFLLSLCFCRACCVMGEEEGIAMEELRKQLQRILLLKLTADYSSSANPDNVEQLSGLIAISEALQQLIRLRFKTVTRLVKSIRSATDGTTLSVFTSSFVGSPSNIWMEGISLPDLRTTADVFHLLAYSTQVDAVNGDLIFCLGQIADASRLNLTLNLGLPATPTLEHAMGEIEYAWGQGVRRFAFFNYGTLTDGRLRWVKDIAKALCAKETAG